MRHTESRNQAGSRWGFFPPHTPTRSSWSWATSRSRASRKSAEWCLKSVDQCWSHKERAIRPSEQEEARKAYDLARRAYRKIREEAAEN